MDYSSYDKRIPPRLYPWWLILVGFVFGVIAAVVFGASRPPTATVYYPNQNDPAIWMQATALIQEATLMAHRSEFQPPADPIFATATAFIEQATAQAKMPVIMPDDPFALTATAMIAQATQMAPPNPQPLISVTRSD